MEFQEEIGNLILHAEGRAIHLEQLNKKEEKTNGEPWRGSLRRFQMEK